MIILLGLILGFILLAIIGWLIFNMAFGSLVLFSAFKKRPAPVQRVQTAAEKAEVAAAYSRAAERRKRQGL